MNVGNTVCIISVYFDQLLYIILQGEENEVILLSLVRSNTDMKIGFLALTNRICVALSRARSALYIFGNDTVYRECSRKWNVSLFNQLYFTACTHDNYI